MRAVVLALSAGLLVPSVASADAVAPDVQRLLDARKPLHFNVTLPGKSARYGHAEALVSAPAETVRDTALQFADYKNLHRKFASARVVARTGEFTDVYMNLPVKLGPFRFEQWAVMRFGAVQSLPDGTFVLEGRSLRGNMKDGHIVVRMKPVDAKHSILAVDLLLLPGLPAPKSMVDEELRDAALDFVDGLKNKAQGWSGPVVTL